MTNEQAVQLIQDRIDELLEDTSIQMEMINLKRDGLTNKEIQDWITRMAIATLAGF